MSEEGIWKRKAISRSEYLARKLPHKWLEIGGQGA
jgi:hypothetical protein